MKLDKTLDRYYILIHELYSNLMLFEIEHLKKGLMRDITFHEIHTIEIIGHSGETSMRELAQKANVKQSTMTVMIDKLIRKGLVRRYQRKDDRRLVMVRLTKNGETAHAEHNKVHQNITKLWLEILDGKERDDLLKIMEKISRHMRG
ncbi:MAG: MarR family transcriptional regulator [Spirochaetes bacterium]|nr:MAG: MarR family transcriptional regulator [Spirochaetota bacterium]